VKYKTVRKIMLFWTLFIVLGAVAGATGMLCDPTGKAMGMDAMLPYFQKLPFADFLFRDFIFSGISLLIVNGLTNLTAAFLIFRKKIIGDALGCVFGVTLMLWICIQFYMFPFNFMSTAYFVFGLLQATTGYYSFVLHKREMFAVNNAEYKNIGKDSKKLVVFYSRTGYGKTLAYKTADRLGANIYEIKTKEKTDGFLGFMWCGRFGMHRWEMPIEPISVNLEAFESVTIISPVWVFALSSPIRTFCRIAEGKIKNVDLFSIHFSKGKYENLKSEAEELLQAKINNYQSLVCRFGKIQ